MRKIPEQENLRVYILWENARVYNREGNNHGAEVSQCSLRSSPKIKNICIKKMFFKEQKIMRSAGEHEANTK